MQKPRNRPFRRRRRPFRGGAPGGRPPFPSGFRGSGGRSEVALVDTSAPPLAGGELVSGMLEVQPEGFGVLRWQRFNFLPTDRDLFVPVQLVRRYSLRDGSDIAGHVGPPRRPGQRTTLLDVTRVDGLDPEAARECLEFKKLTSIDPDFQYELGDAPLEEGEPEGDISLRVLDLLTPIGRGQRGLIVSPPRAGKTILLQKIAQVMERKYPDVHLMILLVDERPEEGTYWRRATKGEVFLSTLDQPTKNHIAIAEAVWRRARHLVERGKEVMVLLDSITRLARAYNHEVNSGRIMSGGIDARTMERPKQLFGSARNTEEGGALTILGTALVDTGSRMDQVIYEEFKGTGNMELHLSRALADRRIFPAFDISMSGTRKEEKLFSSTRLKRVATLRRVLNRLKPIEAMELLIQKLSKSKDNDEFLKAFELADVA
ncbi:MAG TPA: transcription termination factor Rho [Planctomycetota bacterium]|nr:transcription termination factor Rho [Planctomycetota bacterium]